MLLNSEQAWFFQYQFHPLGEQAHCIQQNELFSQVHTKSYGSQQTLTGHMTAKFTLSVRRDYYNEATHIQIV